MKSRKRDTVPMRFGALDVGVLNETAIEIEITNLNVGRRPGTLVGQVVLADGQGWQAQSLQVMTTGEDPYPMHVPATALNRVGQAIAETVAQWVEQNPYAMAEAKLVEMADAVKDSERRKIRLLKRQAEIAAQLAEHDTTHAVLVAELAAKRDEVEQARAAAWNATPAVTEAGLGLPALDD